MSESKNRYRYAPFGPKFKPQKLNTEAEYIDVSPDTPSQDIPLLYAPGWGIHSDVLRPTVSAFVQGSDEQPGRRTIAIGAPHGIDTKQKEGVPHAEERKVAAILEVLNQRGAERVDAVAHSESGLSLTEAALRHPERFRTIILVNSGGLIEKDAPLKVATRTVLDTVVDFGQRMKSLFTGGYKPGDASRTANLARMAVMQQTVTGPNPLRSLNQIKTIGNGDIRERLKQLRAKGVRVVVIQTENDGAFPPERTAIGDEHYDERIILPGRHNEIVTDPEQLAVKILEAARRHGPAQE